MYNKATLPLLFYPQKPNGYTVICPALQGCISEGNTYDEAYKRIMELIEDKLNHMDIEEKEDLFEGFGVPGKIFTEVEVNLNDNTRAN